MDGEFHSITIFFLVNFGIEFMHLNLVVGRSFTPHQYVRKKIEPNDTLNMGAICWNLVFYLNWISLSSSSFIILVQTMKG